MTIDDLKKKSVIELKAMVFDVQVELDRSTQNKNILLQIIQEKLNQPIINEPVPAETKPEGVSESAIQDNPEVQ